MFSHFSKKSTKNLQNFFMFFCLNRVHCIEFIYSTNPDNRKKSIDRDFIGIYFKIADWRIFVLGDYFIMNAYLILFAAIAFEIMATSLVKLSNGFTNLLPTSVLLVFYGISFYLLSLSVKTIPLGIAYAIWSGVGIVVISFVGIFAFKQNLDFPAILGIALIMIGCVIINIFSKSSVH